MANPVFSKETIQNNNRSWSIYSVIPFENFVSDNGKGSGFSLPSKVKNLLNLTLTVKFFDKKSKIEVFSLSFSKDKASPTFSSTGTWIFAVENQKGLSLYVDGQHRGFISENSFTERFQKELIIQYSKNRKTVSVETVTKILSKEAVSKVDKTKRYSLKEFVKAGEQYLSLLDIEVAWNSDFSYDFGLFFGVLPNIFAKNWDVKDSRASHIFYGEEKARTVMIVEKKPGATFSIAECFESPLSNFTKISKLKAGDDESLIALSNADYSLRNQGNCKEGAYYLSTPDKFIIVA